MKSVIVNLERKKHKYIIQMYIMYEQCLN